MRSFSPLTASFLPARLPSPNMQIICQWIQPSQSQSCNGSLRGIHALSCCHMSFPLCCCFCKDPANGSVNFSKTTISLPFPIARIHMSKSCLSFISRSSTRPRAKEPEQGLAKRLCTDAESAPTTSSSSEFICRRCKTIGFGQDVGDVRGGWKVKAKLNFGYENLNFKGLQSGRNPAFMAGGGTGTGTLHHSVLSKTGHSDRQACVEERNWNARRHWKRGGPKGIPRDPERASSSKVDR
jgi:hypothetical protein